LEKVDLNSPYFQGVVGPLCDLKTMAVVSGISQAAKETLSKIEQEVSYWRSILGDGNCFYRSFMFAVLEFHILNNDDKSLKKIMCDIDSIPDKEFKRKDVPLSKQEILEVLFIIIDEMKNKRDIKKAYSFLLKAYNSLQNFDYVKNLVFNL